MMKWKVVRNCRSASADRSLECLKNDVKTQPSGSNETNNNVGEDNNNKQGNNNNQPKEKDTNKQRDSSLVRKPSIVTTDCINLKSFLGLSRQRSETNLSKIGLLSSEPRRSRSEVRGISCDRLTVGYHTTPSKPLETGKTRSSSPPLKSGCWIRGRKREREARNPVKNNNLDSHGKTIVTDSINKRANSKNRNGDCRTIVDGCESKKNKAPTKPSSETRKSKSSKRSGEEDIIEEEVIYSEIVQDNVHQKLLDENKETFKDPKKVIRKKGMAPKPQIATALFKETSGMEVNLNPSGRKQSGSPNSLNEKSRISEAHKSHHRRNQTYNGRNQERKTENRIIQSVKINNLKNSEMVLLKNNNLNVQSVVAIAEVHKEILPTNFNKHNNDSECESVKNDDINNTNKILPSNKDSFNNLIENKVEIEDPPPYHIDTPDYSTLDSVNCCNFASMEDATYSKDDVINCNTDCDESVQDSFPIVNGDNAKSIREISLSSILRDSSNENKIPDSEPKKTVRFEKLDLIEKYKKSKTESLMDIEDDTDKPVCKSTPLLKNILDVNCNEISSSDTQSLLEEFSQMSQSSDKNVEDSVGETCCPSGMTVNILVRNSSSTQHVQPNPHIEESPTQFVVKKSFVITVAKQERGFKSLCDTKKPEVAPEQPKNNQQISVTFLCSGPPSEGWIPPNNDGHQRLRSISVPPRSLQQPVEIVTALPSIRGRSRERRSKERSHCKKNHKTKKKDAVFVMPQAVIDELSQVLEKRKPSLDEIPLHP